MFTKNYLVTGKVQGVWFRQSTKEFCLQAGITGSAINLVTGQVKVMATGSEQQHEQLLDYLRQGPELAEVDTVEPQDMPLTEFTGFTTG